MGIGAYVTDETVENEGIWHSFEGNFKLRLARSGGSNVGYLRAVAARAEAMRDLPREDWSTSRSQAEILVEAVIKDAEGDFTGTDGEPLEIGSDKLVDELLKAPELMLLIAGLSTDRRWYRVIEGVDVAGKSSAG